MFIENDNPENQRISLERQRFLSDAPILSTFLDIRRAYSDLESKRITRKTHEALVTNLSGYFDNKWLTAVTHTNSILLESCMRSAFGKTNPLTENPEALKTLATTLYLIGWQSGVRSCEFIPDILNQLQYLGMLDAHEEFSAQRTFCGHLLGGIIHAGAEARSTYNTPDISADISNFLREASRGLPDDADAF